MHVCNSSILLGVGKLFMGGIMNKLEDAFNRNSLPISERLPDLVSRFPDCVVNGFNYPDR